MDGMQDSSRVKVHSNAEELSVAKSLRKSNVRKKITDYLLAISPSSSYVSEIAYHIRSTPTNVIWAIRGMGSRYRDDGSLISLNIVEQTSDGRDNNTKSYRLTDFGKEIIESIRDKDNKNLF